jgi:hypothetical protein
LLLVLASMINKWPYRCVTCGAEFFLDKRHLRRKTDQVTTDRPAAAGEAPGPPADIG